MKFLTLFPSAPTALGKGRVGLAFTGEITARSINQSEASRDASRPDESFESITTLSEDEEGLPDDVPLAQIFAKVDMQPIHARTSPSGKGKGAEVTSKLTVRARQNKLNLETKARTERSSWNWSQMPDVTDPSIQPKLTAEEEEEADADAVSSQFAQAESVAELDGPSIAAKIRAAQAARQAEDGGALFNRRPPPPQDIMFWDPAPRPKIFDPVKALEKARRDALSNERAASKFYKESSKIRKTEIAKARVLPVRGRSLVTLAPIPMAIAQGSSRGSRSRDSREDEPLPLALDSAGRPAPAKGAFIGAEESQERRAARMRARTEAELVSGSEAGGRGTPNPKRVKFSAEVRGGEDETDAQDDDQQASEESEYEERPSKQADLARPRKHPLPEMIAPERSTAAPKPAPSNHAQEPTGANRSTSSHSFKQRQIRNTELDTELDTEMDAETKSKPQLVLAQEPAAGDLHGQNGETAPAAKTGKTSEMDVPADAHAASASKLPPRVAEKRPSLAVHPNSSERTPSHEPGPEPVQSSGILSTWDEPSIPKMPFSFFKNVAQQVAWIEQRRFVARNKQGRRRIDGKKQKAALDANPSLTPAEISHALAALPDRPLFAGLRFYIVEAYDKSVYNWVNRITKHGGVIMTDKEAIFAHEKDNAPTHLVTHLTGKKCCQELGLKSLERLLPNVVAVKLTWLTECIEVSDLRELVCARF